MDVPGTPTKPRMGVGAKVSDKSICKIHRAAWLEMVRLLFDFRRITYEIQLSSRSPFDLTEGTRARFLTHNNPMSLPRGRFFYSSQTTKEKTWIGT